MAVEVIAGRKTGVRYAGIGEPAVLLHCSLAHSGAWAGVMAGLADRLAMVAIDLPGHGATEFDPEIEVQAQACETAIALLERFDVPAHLVGHSFGATVALRLATMRPDLVASLSLYEPVYFSFLVTGNSAAHLQEVEDSRPFTDCALNNDWVGAADAFLARWGEGQRFSEVPEAQQAFILNVLPVLVAPENPIIDGCAGDEMLRNLPNISAPCLLMEGQNSPVVVERINSVLAERIPTVERKVFLGAGHMGPITHSTEVSRVMGEFLFGDET